jgi:hypothetical protein
MVKVLSNLNNLFRRKNGKWHEVRWRNGPRQIFMALRFATDGASPADHPPTIEKLTPQQDPDGAAAEAPVSGADEGQIVREVQAAVAEYNKMNLCALRVAGIRYRATGDADPADHGTATRKLLNLL